MQKCIVCMENTMRETFSRIYGEPWYTGGPGEIFKESYILINSKNMY